MEIKALRVEWLVNERDGDSRPKTKKKAEARKEVLAKAVFFVLYVLLDTKQHGCEPLIQP